MNDVFLRVTDFDGMVATAPFFSGNLGAGMAIKNWTVRTKSVTGGSGGVAAYGRYLEDENHRNHRGKTEAITPVIGDWKKLLATQTLRATERNAQQIAGGKGGRTVQTLAQSFVVSLPAGLRPTPEQWRGISRDVVTAIQERLPEGQKLRGMDLFINAHENTSNPHLNLVIGKLAPDGSIRKKVTQKAVLSAVKNAVNAAVLRELGADHVSYEPKRTKVGNKPKWAYEKMQAQEELEQAVSAIRDSHRELDELAEESLSARSDVALARDIADALGDRQLSDIVAEAEARMPPLSDRESALKAEYDYESERDRNNDWEPPSPSPFD